MTAPDPIRVLVVDDQRLVCDGLVSLLDTQADIRVVGTAADGREALAQVERLQPDVALMDIRMPVMDGVEATRRITAQHPTCQVLVLTTFDDEATVITAIQAGAAGYLLKNIPAPELAQAVRAAHSRLATFDRVIAGKVVAALRPAPVAADPAVDTLTPREHEVLYLIAQGKSNREIATALVITESTVKAHVSSILNRLGLRDRTQAALYARDRG